MVEYEPLTGSEETQVTLLKPDGTTKQVTVSGESATVDVGEVEYDVELEDAAGVTSVSVNQNERLKLDQQIEFVTHDSVSGTTDVGITIQDKIDLSKGDYFRYSARMPGSQSIRLLGEEDTIEIANGTWRTPATGIGGRVLLSTYTPDFLTGSGLDGLEYTFKVQTKEPVINSIIKE